MRFLCKILPALALLTLPAAAAAQCRTVYPTYTYQQPTYYSAPTYYQAPKTYETIKVTEVIVPILQPLPVFVDPRISYLHNGSNVIFAPQQPVQQVQQPVQQEKQPDIDELIDRIERRVRERSGERNPEPDGPPPVPGVRAAADTPLTILKASCYGCHSGARPRGDFLIFSGADILSPRLDRAAVVDAIKEGRMPPPDSNKPRVTPEKLLVLRRSWGL